MEKPVNKIPRKDPGPGPEGGSIVAQEAMVATLESDV